MCKFLFTIVIFGTVFNSIINATETDNELERVEFVKIVSLQNDTDVNYINQPNAFDKNAEYVNEKIDLTIIPKNNNSAVIARYIIHNVDWTAIATLSTNTRFKGAPFVNVISVSDGPVKNGTGVPYFYMTPKDFSAIDIEKDNRCSITATLAQTDYCKKEKLDPQSPICARLILSGKIKRVRPYTEEYHFAKEALFSRHPAMATWPADHGWFFAKLKIKQIIVLDHFGGATYVSLQDYFEANRKKLH